MEVEFNIPPEGQVFPFVEAYDTSGEWPTTVFAVQNLGVANIEVGCNATILGPNDGVFVATRQPGRFSVANRSNVGTRVRVRMEHWSRDQDEGPPGWDAKRQP